MQSKSVPPSSLFLFLTEESCLVKNQQYISYNSHSSVERSSYTVNLAGFRHSVITLVGTLSLSTYAFPRTRLVPKFSEFLQSFPF